MHDLIVQGAELFNSRRYFEAHEAFEDLWRQSDGDLRLFHQGIVQCCAGLVKHQRGQLAPACTLLRKGLDKLVAAPPGLQPGVDLAALIAELTRVLAAAQTGSAFEPPVMTVLDGHI